MEYMFQDMITKGHAVSTLYPFKESFYGRFGYVNLAQALKATISHSNLSSLVSNLELPVRYERYHIKERTTRMIELLNRFQQQTQGMALFPENILQYLETQDL